MPIIQLCDITKNYGSKTIFDGLSLSVNEGEFIAVMGNSGCGKSTLLNIIGLLEDYDDGELIIDGESNISTGSRKANTVLRKKISYLFQNYALVEDETVAYNILLALKYINKNKKEKINMMKEALNRVGLDDYEKHRIYELSGGEQQRVAIARLLVKPSKIILADEPTGSLDETNRDIVLGLLQSLNKSGKTILLVTHDKYVASQCHRIVEM